ncbi:hypothetical protein JTB14_004043 [Gonioctena quinquepunctata]|nr:hypothetical protein JTB14_004043 [Gonioctena quinquepunctata]
MGKICAIKSCSSGRKNSKNKKDMPQSLSFFQATESKRLANWTKCLGMDLKKSDYICQLHFKADHIKMYDKIKIGNVVNLIYLSKKKLHEEALPTIEHTHQLHSDLQQQHETIMSVENPEEQLYISRNKKKQQKQNAETNNELQQTSIEQQSNHHCNDFQEQTLDDFQPQHTLKNKINNVLMLPAFWFFSEKPKEFEFMRIDPTTKRIKNHIRLNEDLSLTVVCSNNDEIDLDEKLTSLDNIHHYLKSVENWPLCIGTQIKKKKFSKKCKGVIIGDETYERTQMNLRCKSCRMLRNQLQTRSLTPSCCLKKSGLRKNRSRNLSKQVKHLKTTANQQHEDHEIVPKSVLLGASNVL